MGNKIVRIPTCRPKRSYDGFHDDPQINPVNKKKKSNYDTSGLSRDHLNFLMNETDLSEAQIQDLFQKFLIANPKGQLNKENFKAIYTVLRHEPPERLDELCQLIFKTMDTDNSGFLNFDEFLIGYAMTSSANLELKLSYAFDLYDTDGSGYLNKQEIQVGLVAMLDLLNVNKSRQNDLKLANEFLTLLDANNDGIVSKSEFVQGLKTNYALRGLMSPFN